MNDGNSDDDDDSFSGKNKFDSDEEEIFHDNTGARESSTQPHNLDESDNLFDSLKEDTPAKKPPAAKRKLGAKVEAVKASAKRSKSSLDTSNEDSPIKVKVKLKLKKK